MPAKIYTAGDLVELLDDIVLANFMMRQDAAHCHDEGTSVLGAGIVVDYDAPKTKRARDKGPVRKLLVVAPFQGNVGSHKACARALAFLQKQGVDARWYDGAMD